MERLTAKTANGFALKLEGITNEEEARIVLQEKFKEALNKLGKLEDLQEQRRQQDEY